MRWYGENALWIRETGPVCSDLGVEDGGSRRFHHSYRFRECCLIAAPMASAILGGTAFPI
jgi:hypothetical protein